MGMKKSITDNPMLVNSPGLRVIITPRAIMNFTIHTQSNEGYGGGGVPIPKIMLIPASESFQGNEIVSEKSAALKP